MDSKDIMVIEENGGSQYFLPFPYRFLPNEVQ